MYTGQETLTCTQDRRHTEGAQTFKHTHTYNKVYHMLGFIRYISAQKQKAILDIIL